MTVHQHEEWQLREGSKGQPYCAACGEKIHRPLYIIADDIMANWKRPYFGAQPYLDAMRSLVATTDSYGADSAKSVVAYFLANAGTWRGESARRIKAELKGMI